MLVTIAAAAALFAATNVDDLVVITVLVAGVQRNLLSGRALVVGQYLGFCALVGLSAGAAAGLAVVSEETVNLLGLIPLGMGLWGLITFVRRLGDSDGEECSSLPRGWLGVAGLTMANGADNVAVYTPIFRGLSTADAATTIVTFLVLVAVWLRASLFVGSRPFVVSAIEKAEAWLVPMVFVVLGVLILSGG